MPSFDYQLSEDELDDAMRSIGMRVGRGVLTATPADIEHTLVSAAERSLPHGYRVLGVLIAWLGMHHSRVNTRRLLRVLRQRAASPTHLAFWSAIAHWLAPRDSHWKAMRLLYNGAPINLDDAEINAIQMERLGPDPRFLGSALVVHSKLFRDRTQDVATVQELVAGHSIYRKRVEFGPVYRADLWCALEIDPQLSAPQLAQKVGCSEALASRVLADYQLLRVTPVAEPVLPTPPTGKDVDSNTP